MERIKRKIIIAILALLLVIAVSAVLNVQAWQYSQTSCYAYTYCPNLGMSISCFVYAGNWWGSAC